MKAKVILLPSETPSPLGTLGESSLLLIDDSKEEVKVEGVPNINYYHIYLVDPNAEIKDGDWCIDWNGVEQVDKPTVDMINAGMLHNGHVKVICSTDKSLTPEYIPSQEPYGAMMKEDHSVLVPNPFKIPQLSEQSIKLLIDYYNKNGKMPDEVEVECIKTPDGVFYHNDVPYSSIKLNPQGEVDIAIPEEKFISWSKFLEFKKLADDIIIPACDILPETYDEEIEAYEDWSKDNLK